MTEVNGAEWLDAIHAHHERDMSLPVLVGAEVLLGRTDAASVAKSIVAGGIAVSYSDMAATTDDTVEEAIQSLSDLGFLDDQFSLDHGNVREEHVLELRYP
jgi:hypothetical protein